MKAPASPRLGFSLVEVLIVTAIVAVLASAAVGIFRTFASEASGARAMHDIEQIYLACNRYQQLEGRQAKSIAELLGRYLQEVNNDPWGEPYAIAWGYVISGGEDGERGTEDDLQRCSKSYPNADAEAAGTAALIAEQASTYESVTKSKLTSMATLIAWLDTRSEKLGPPVVDPWKQPYRVDGALKDIVSDGADKTRENDDDVRASFSKDICPMVKIPAGEFAMGTDAADPPQFRPAHRVFIDAFRMDVAAVTNERYRKFMQDTGRPPPAWISTAQDKQPVVGVTWDDACKFCEWAGKRLPTEAEWEKAARGGLEGKKYPWGDGQGTGLADFGKSPQDGPAPVGSFPANGYGLHDMAGNVYQWCIDWFDPGYYAVSPSRNPQGAGGGTYRVVRGGSFVDPLVPVYARQRQVPTLASHLLGNVGFRCVKSR